MDAKRAISVNIIGLATLPRIYRTDFSESRLNEKSMRKKSVTPTSKRTGLGIWAVSQVALELSRDESNRPDLDRFEKNLPRVLEALLKVEDKILEHYGEVANDHFPNP